MHQELAQPTDSRRFARLRRALVGDSDIPWGYSEIEDDGFTVDDDIACGTNCALFHAHDTLASADPGLVAESAANVLGVLADLPRRDAHDTSARARAVRHLRRLRCLARDAAAGGQVARAVFPYARAQALDALRSYSALVSWRARTQYRVSLRRASVNRCTRPRTSRRNNSRAPRSRRVACAATKTTGDPDPEPEPPRAPSARACGGAS